MSALAAAPGPARWLGFAGLLPFLAGAVGTWLLPPEAASVARYAQIAYGAVILSFLGAIHWGLAVAGTAAPSWNRLGWSVAPALLGWAALLMGDVRPALILLMLGLAAAFGADRNAAREGLLPTWYAALRRPLTALAVVALGASLMASL